MATTQWRVLLCFCFSLLAMETFQNHFIFEFFIFIFSLRRHFASVKKVCCGGVRRHHHHPRGCLPLCFFLTFLSSSLLPPLPSCCFLLSFLCIFHSLPRSGFAWPVLAAGVIPGCARNPQSGLPVFTRDWLSSALMLFLVRNCAVSESASERVFCLLLLALVKGKSFLWVFVGGFSYCQESEE